MRMMPAEQASTLSPHGPETQLKGLWLSAARGAWVFLLLLQGGAFIASVPVYYAAQVQFASTPEMVAGLRQLGLSAGFYAAEKTALELLMALVCVTVSTIIVWRRSTQPIAHFFALILILYGVAPSDDHRIRLPALLEASLVLISFVRFAALSPLIYLFPDGRFVPRWTRWVTPWWIAIQASITIIPWSPLNIWEWPALPKIAVLCAFLLSLVVAPIYRYRHAAGPIERQQIKWVVLAFIVLFLAGFGMLFLRLLFPTQLQPGTVVYLGGEVVLSLCRTAIPLAIGLAVLRYRLWDVDVLINRALVYGLLTAAVVGLYTLIVAGLGTLLQARGNFALAFVATGLIAVLFQPVRDGIQRRVNRLMYGERDDPYAALSHLGQRLEATLDPAAVLSTIVHTVQETLRLPYVAIALEQGGDQVIAAAAGLPVDETVDLPLVYQRERVGHLRVAPRSQGEGFGAADRRLLDDLARQAGVAVHGVRLTTDLQRARERLVTAREEERRRLRRDLHDGLGPQLASQPLTIDAVRKVLAHDPAGADALLQHLKAQSQDAVADIRRLIYDLRPPALDDLGLVGAIRQQAAEYQAAGLHMIVEAPECAPQLPAAVEVAAYRIVQEALANVVRHAHAQHCTIRLALEDALSLEIRDDGRGLPEQRRAGVGLQSMRERVEELSGDWTIEPLPEGGTRVRARLPLPQEEAWSASRS